MKNFAKIGYIILSILILAGYIYLLSKNGAFSNPFRSGNDYGYDYDYERDGCCSCCSAGEMCMSVCCPCK